MTASVMSIPERRRREREAEAQQELDKLPALPAFQDEAKLRSLRTTFNREAGPPLCSGCLARPAPRYRWAEFEAPHVTLHFCDRCLDFLVARFGGTP